MSFLLPLLPPTFEAALRDVSARTPELRAAAAERLGTAEPLAHADALRGLRVLAADVDPRVRASAVRALAQLAAPDSLDILRDRMTDADATVRELTIVAIDALDIDEALHALEGALTSPHPEVRFQAVLVCAQRAPDRNASAILALLHDGDAQVRGNAARACGLLSPPPGPEPLLPMLDDLYFEARYEAALALAQLGHSQGAPVLSAALDDPERVLDALDALGGLAQVDALEPVRHLTTNLWRSRIVKVAAARALVRQGDPRGIEALREVLHAFRNEGRSFAVEVVGELGLAALRPELERLLPGGRGVEPWQLTEALARLPT